MAIGKNIALYRKLNNSTQAELSKAVGISRGYLVAIERGRKIPGIKVVARIANHFDLRLEDLLKE